MSNRTRLLNALYLIGQPLLMNAVSLPAMAYIIRMLGPAGFGQWIAATSLAATAFVIASPGLRTLFVRSIAQQPENAPEALGEQLGLRCLLAIAASMVAIAACFALRYPPAVLASVSITCIGLGLSTFWTALSDVLQGFERFRSTATISLVSGMILTLVSVLAAWRGAGAVEMSIAYLSGPAVSLFMLAYAVQSNLFPIRVVWNASRYKTLLWEVRVLGAQQFLSAVQDRIEQLLIPKMLGMSAFGYFAAGSMPASRLVVFPDGLSTSYYPRISASVHEEPGRAHDQVSQLLLISLVACIPLAILLSFLAAPLSQLLFPGRPLICREIIQVTIWSLPIQGLMLPLMYAMQAAGHHAQAARSTMWATVAGSLLSIALIGRFGIAGACWSWILRPAFAILFVLPHFVRVFPGVMSRIPIRRISCAAALMSGVLWCSVNIRLPALTAIVLGSSLALLLYAGGLIFLRVFKFAHLQLIFKPSRAVDLE